MVMHYVYLQYMDLSLVQILVMSLGSMMLNALAQHLEVWMDSHLVHIIVQF